MVLVEAVSGHSLRRPSPVWLGEFAFDLLQPWVTERREGEYQFQPSLPLAAPWLRPQPVIDAVVTYSHPYWRSDVALGLRSCLFGAGRFWTVMPLGVEAMALQLRSGPVSPS